MKIAIISRTNDTKMWGGDLKALLAIESGLKGEGQEAWIAKTALEAIDADFIFLANTCLDLQPDFALIQLWGKPFGLVGFHEDVIRWCAPASGLFRYLQECLQTTISAHFSIERLLETPEVVYYHPSGPRLSNFYNYPILKSSKLCIANCSAEAETMKRDCPDCRVEVVLWSPGFAEGSIEEYIGEDFLEFSGLKSGEYLLQVGRLELRKNQIGTILAAKDLDIPLVFIATAGMSKEYEALFLQAIARWRKGPTLLVSQNLPPVKEKNFRILPMPGRKKLSRRMLLSAFAHAGLHIHPAFSELPGYTYLEAARLGVPSIASEWTTIRDYFTNPITKQYELDERISYFCPYKLAEIGRAIPRLFGKRFPRKPEHPIFKRTSTDIGKEFMALLRNLPPE